MAKKYAKMQQYENIATFKKFAQEIWGMRNCFMKQSTSYCQSRFCIYTYRSMICFVGISLDQGQNLCQKIGIKNTKSTQQYPHPGGTAY